MAYFDGYGFTDLKGQWRYAPVTAVYCDDCAEAEIPLPPARAQREDESDFHYALYAGGTRHHSTGFKWAPHYGGGVKCKCCGKLV